MILRLQLINQGKELRKFAKIGVRKIRVVNTMPTQMTTYVLCTQNVTKIRRGMKLGILTKNQVSIAQELNQIDYYLKRIWNVKFVIIIQ